MIRFPEFFPRRNLMNLSKHAYALILFSIVFIGSVSTAPAQTDASQQLEPSYEIALHVVVGSNDAAKTDLPGNLSNISRYLKGNFPFSTYRLTNTMFGRISNTGTVEYKGVTNVFGMENDADLQSFLDWTIGGFRALPTGFQARSFRFGARVPVRVSPGGPAVSYESIGLSMNMIGLPSNKPTLIGTIGLPRASGTMFLIATVRTAEM
jgi:hypothetical protein